MHPIFDIGLAERAQLRKLPSGEALVVASGRRDAVLSHAQLIDIGLSKPAISRRLGTSLFVQHRGIYAVGRPDLPRRGRLRAAILRCGRTSALSLRTSAAEHDIADARWRVAITTTGTGRRPPRASGIDLHYAGVWRPGEVVWVGGFPCTSVARTLADLAGADAKAFTRAWNRADRQLLLDVHALAAEAARERKGCVLLRSRLDHYEEAPPTESELEDLGWELWAAEGLPRPTCQWPLTVGDRPGRVDFVFPGGVAVELDSRRWPAIQQAQDADREKDMALREAGFDPHRYGWKQIVEQGPRVAALVRAAIASRPSARQASPTTRSVPG